MPIRVRPTLLHGARASALLAALALLAAGCASAPQAPPFAGAEPVDHLIQPGEEHFAHLWKLTSDGENAEGYFSPDGQRLVLQRRNAAEGIECDRIFVLGRAGELQQVSSGDGTTTCAYFLPDGERVVFASTQAHQEDCPPRPDFSQGYVWPLHPEFDLWVRELGTGAERRLDDTWGYDAEATVSPRGDRMVFTSTRSGDLELWTCALDGSDLLQVTDELGYDGGAFFSHDGTKLVFRTTFFDPADLAEEQRRYRELLDRWQVRPHSMEIMVVDADGSNRRQVTSLGKASFAPYFFPDDQRIVFSSNHHSTGEGMINFDLFAIDLDGGNLERVTTYASFDSFPMFSPDGRWLVFASNRGGKLPTETNLFLAEWQ